MSIKRSPELEGLSSNRVRAALFYARKRRLERKRLSSNISGTPPQLATIADGAALSTSITWGTYADSDNIYRFMKLNSGSYVPYDGATVVEEGQLWTLRETVELDGVTRSFTSNTQEVTA